MSILRLDPTRTTMLRRRFEIAMRLRYDLLRRKLYEMLIERDAFGLGPYWLISNDEEWRFMPPDRKLDAFRNWFALEAGRLLLSQGQQASNTWVGEHVRKSYERGLKRSWGDWRRPTQTLLMKPEAGAIYQQGQMAEFMRQSFGGPTPTERVNVLAARVFSDLKGSTEQLSSRISSLLLDGMSSGLNPRTVGKELNNLVDGYKNRGTTIARTEMIRAFNEGALDGLENLGATQIGVMVEWSVSGMGVTKLGNLSPCKKCAPLAGLVLSVDEARGLLPRHPNCMCSLIPANVGEKTQGQIRDAERIRKAIERSARGDRHWLGASKKISSARPS